MSKLTGVFALLAVGCVDPAMEQRISELEKKVAEVEKRPAGGGAGTPAAMATPEEEKAAGDLLTQAQELVEGNKIDEAKAKLTELAQKYPSSSAARRAQRLITELAVVGVEAGQPEVEKWYQGNGSFSEGKATLVVFWETWCPHCQREVPTLEKTYQALKGQGLNVVALTKVTKSSSDEKVVEFMKEHKLSFPMGKEKGATMSEKFGVSGIPAAVLIKDGKVVWRGHPARMTEDKLKTYL